MRDGCGVKRASATHSTVATGQLQHSTLQWQKGSVTMNEFLRLKVYSQLNLYM